MHQIAQKISLIAVALIIIGGALVTTHVVAQEGDPGGSGLRISPTRTELNLEEGASELVTHTVKNVTQSPVTVQPTLNDFESDGVTGQPQLIANPDGASARSLREFLVLPEDFDLQPDEEREVTVSVQVPARAAPGGYYGSVIYRAAPLGTTGEGQVLLVASVGSLILVDVPGDITEQIEVVSVGAYVGDTRGTLLTGKPENIGVLINNLGNGFARPFGKVTVSGPGLESFEYEINDVNRRSNILPETSRLFLQEFVNIEEKTVNGEPVQEKTSPITWPGKYTITGNISHGTAGELFTVSASFWYLPIWFLVLVVAVLLLIVGGILHLRKRFTRPRSRRR